VGMFGEALSGALNSVIDSQTLPLTAIQEAGKALLSPAAEFGDLLSKSPLTVVNFMLSKALYHGVKDLLKFNEQSKFSGIENKIDNIFKDNAKPEEYMLSRLSV